MIFKAIRQLTSYCYNWAKFRKYEKDSILMKYMDEVNNSFQHFLEEGEIIKKDLISEISTYNTSFGERITYAYLRTRNGLKTLEIKSYVDTVVDYYFWINDIDNQLLKKAIKFIILNKYNKQNHNDFDRRFSSDLTEQLQRETKYKIPSLYYIQYAKEDFKSELNYILAHKNEFQEQFIISKICSLMFSYRDGENPYAEFIAFLEKFIKYEQDQEIKEKILEIFILFNDFNCHGIKFNLQCFMEYLIFNHNDPISVLKAYSMLYPNKDLLRVFNGFIKKDILLKQYFHEVDKAIIIDLMKESSFFNCGLNSLVTYLLSKLNYNLNEARGYLVQIILDKDLASMLSVENVGMIFSRDIIMYELEHYRGFDDILIILNAIRDKGLLSAELKSIIESKKILI